MIVKVQPSTGVVSPCSAWRCEHAVRAARVAQIQSKRIAMMEARVGAAYCQARTLPLRVSVLGLTIWADHLRKEAAWTRFLFAAFCISNATSSFPVDVVASNGTHFRCAGLRTGGFAFSLT